MKNSVAQKKASNPDKSFAASLQGRVAAFGGVERLNWIYGNDIGEVWKAYVEKDKSRD